MSIVWRGVMVSVGVVLICVCAPVIATELRGPDALGALVDPPQQPSLYEIDFSTIAYGRAPVAWKQLATVRPSRNWAVDGNGFLRVMIRDYRGLIVYAGTLADGSKPDALVDVTIDAPFKKTEDDECVFGMAVRVRDQDNYYYARLAGGDSLELYKVKAGEATLLVSEPLLNRYREKTVWRMTMAARGPLFAAAVHDDQGVEMARVDGKDDEFKTGSVGLRASTYAAARSFRIRSGLPLRVSVSPDEITKRNTTGGTGDPDYPIVKPVLDKVESVFTPADEIVNDYDVIVAGAGTGGTAAAVAAARLGCRVLLLEESDTIGGQVACVPTMDEAMGKNPPVRERGFYREFVESIAAYYYTLDKDPFKGDRSYQDAQYEAGMEPRVARGVFYAMINDARARGGAKLDLSMQSKVTVVKRSGDSVMGVTLSVGCDPETAVKKEIACKVLIDATEYGDVIPLTGARYRVANVTSDSPNPTALLQDNTWPAVITVYPNGVPEHLRIKSPPPNHATIRRPYAKYMRWGSMFWGKGSEGMKEFQYPLMFYYRCNADTDSSLTGRRSEIRITQCEINGGNDYPVTAGDVEDPARRLANERDGIERSLSALYYFQNELGLNWSLAENEGFNTPYNQYMMKQRGLRPDLEKLAIYLPQQPYVRESRRVIGMKTVVASEMSRFEKAKLMPTSLAMGDYFMDLHGTIEAIESDLDTPDHPKGGGPYQVPFEAFVPEQLDGFLVAEKNLSQSRIVSGATRMQPSTMLTGQASGTIAAVAVKRGVQPRQLDPKPVQATLLVNGSTLVQRWYADVPWGTPIWRATQLLSLYQVMDRPGPFLKDKSPLGAKSKWGVNEPLSEKERKAAIARLVELNPSASGAVRSIPAQLNAGEFAIIAAKILVEGKP